MRESCPEDCKHYDVDQGEYPCNECNRLVVSKDHYKKKQTHFESIGTHTNTLIEVLFQTSHRKYQTSTDDFLILFFFKFSSFIILFLGVVEYENKSYETELFC